MRTAAISSLAKAAAITSHVEMFVVDLLERWRPATSVRYRALQQFSRWALEEGEIAENPMRNMRPPIVHPVEIAVLSDAELTRLLDVCSGPSFRDRRDLAIFRVLIDTGCRASELVGLRIGDVDLDDQHDGHTNHAAPKPPLGLGDDQPNGAEFVVARA